MPRRRWTRALLGIIAFASVIGVCVPQAVAVGSESSGDSRETTSASPVVQWQTAAQKHRILLFAKDRGTLLIDDKGVAFQSKSGRRQNWAFLDIHTFTLAPHRLVLQTYKNRSLHRPGEQRYRFELKQAVPPAVAASLASALGRPSQNAVPDLESPEIASIPVRHRRVAGGTNGLLRFRNDGIDYVTNTPGDSRSWRWGDLQILSDPDPYRLLVFGYRDTYTFDLKEPLSRTLFDQATDNISAYTESESVRARGSSASTTPRGTGIRAENQ